MGTVSVGIDVGGTFTDLLAIDGEGRAESRKVASTPRDQSRGILDALRALGVHPGAIARLVHGSTVATNMLLERTGSRVVLCATAGAADLLELRRQDRASLYDLTRHHPPPLAGREAVVAVDERIAPEGVIRRLEEAAIARAVERVAAIGGDAVAISFLHAYQDPTHEQLLADALGARLDADVAVVASHEVLPEIREYERTATTVAEAYLRRGVGHYLERLRQGVETAGYPAPMVMTSAGGMRDIAAAVRSAAALALSGPAGGMVGAAALARRAGIASALTIDVGGTSADAGLIVGGEALVEHGGDVAGVPIALPRVLVDTVSAGGGSIAWVDAGGALRVGPKSAGADPGPACYGRGGEEATVTDAHVALGQIGGVPFGGGFHVDPTLARAALRRVASALGADVERTARAIVATAEAEIARALRRVSVERGIDPRASTLIAFGGAGPLHACGLAERLGMREVYIPPFAGVLSALGLAIAPPQAEAATSVMRRSEAIDARAAGATMQALAERARETQQGEARWWARARYAGQGHELAVEIEPGDDGSAIAARFASAHRLRARFTLDREVEIVSIRCTVSGSPLEPPDAPVEDSAMRGPGTYPLGDATLLVPGGWTAEPLRRGGFLLRRTA